jgi:phenylacetate-coenzyme A ligase PaaK-like adenylate-forming protein
MKVQQHHSNVDKHMAGELEELRILPWKDKDQFDRNHEVQEIVKKFNKYIRVNLDMDKKFVEINPSSK